MKKPLILIACLALAGCTDAQWNHALNYGGMGEDAEPEMADAPQAPARATAHISAAPQPMAAAPANSDFCRSVATQDATANGFDPATQQRVLAQSYQQCLTIYSR
ncbi:MAG: hypothetical protein NTX21_06885 [Alphaproteobacteria bacterium]|nr:hypothetical protein [Alphaproteobacteria bacterium]